MTARDAERQAQTQALRLQFDRYVLDLRRGCLLLDEREIPLRPKSFAVLRYLVDNGGRLVSKEELFAAVWPRLVVTDDALVQSVSELRQALGVDGPRLIRTVPRRGYRFESAVTVESSHAGHSTDATLAPVPPSTSAGPSRLVPGARSKDARLSIVYTCLTTLVVTLLAAGLVWIGIESDGRPPHPTEGTERASAKSGSPKERTAIAILPFRNQSDRAREYFVDGLTQDVINAMGRFPELAVMSWNAVAPFKATPASPGQVARSLAVDYQVEGSVMQTGDRVRVIAQLVSADGRVLWSARYEEVMADLFALQGKITTQIAGALAIRVARIEQQRVLAKPIESLAAYDYVLRARPAMQRPTRANIAEARALLRRSVQIDPDSAAAYALLAETYLVAVAMGWAESPTEALARAEELASKALRLDESDVRARVTLGRIHIFHQRYERAQAEMDRTLAINPSDAHGLAGRGNVLMWLGQADAAIEALELAQRIDPELNTIDRFALSLAYYLTRRYDAAIEQAEVNLRATADANFSRVVLAAAYAQSRRTDEAERIAAVVRLTDPAFDPRSFGNKFLQPTDLEHLREGFRKAGLLAAGTGSRPSS